MFTGALFTIAKKWKQPKCLSRWMDKEDEIKHQSAIKKNEILPSATTWMDLEGIMLSERSHKDKYCMISLIHWI